MNTLHFKYAVEVERTGSISQAAENLFMAQPNLSKSIKELEDSLGIIIFERTSKGMIPTEQGLEFLKYAKEVLVQLERMKAIHVSKKEREQRQCLKISVPRVSYISYGISNFINELDLQKNIDVHIQETNSVNTIANVISNHADFGIIRYQMMYEEYFLNYIKERKLAYQDLWEFECLVLMSKKHIFAQDESIDYHKLSKQSIEIIHEDNIIPYCPLMKDHTSSVEKMKEGDHKQICVFERGSQFDLLVNVPTTYMRVSPIPNEICQNNQLVQRKCEISNNKFKDVLIYHKNYDFKPADKICIDSIYEARDMLEKLEYN